MFTKSRIVPLLVVLMATAALFSGVAVVYAHCGKCLVDAKAMADNLKKGKVMLAPAVVLAEKSCSGVALKAACHQHEDECFIEVHCVSGDKLMAIAVDAKTGKIARSSEVATLDDHAAAEPVEGGEAEAMSDADIQTHLGEAAAATKAGKFDEAEGIIGKLEALKGTSDTIRGKIDSARSALEAAKTAKAVKDKLPGLP